MKHKYVRLCGIAAMLLAQPAFAQPPIVLEQPLDWQVIQRNAQDWAEIKVEGSAPAGATLVEIKAEPAAGMRGKARDWTAVAQGAQVKDGRFSGDFKLLAGGWYALKVRFRKSTADPAVLGEAAIEHVGVGDIFVVAGQSNSSNHGAEQQKTTTGLVAASDGKKWQLANDPQPGASGGQGSFQPPFGDAMATKFQVPVGIIACGIGATSVREWLPKGATFPNPPTLEGRVRQLPNGEWESKGEAFDMLTSRMKQLGSKGFRAVLWHQGESDAGQPDPKRILSSSSKSRARQSAGTLRGSSHWSVPMAEKACRRCATPRNPCGPTASPLKDLIATRSGATSATASISAARACANMANAGPTRSHRGSRNRQENPLAQISHQ